MSHPVPAEWAPHKAMWVGFPSHAELWEDNLAPARAETAALAKALAGLGREHVKLLVQGPEARQAADGLLEGFPNIEIIDGRFGDIWLRDTGPVFTAPGAAAAFSFNGWGEKYRLEGDEAVAEQLASGAKLVRHSFVLEGGAIDHDGAGTVVTTRQCLLNPNRNLGWREADAERALAAALGVRKVLWLDQGLMNDHTDGHVDNVARFVAPGVVACPASYGEDDPNAAVYDAVARALAGFTDAEGKPLEVARLPSPGRLMSGDHRVVPASHMNFVIANEAVVVPVYDARAGAWAVEALEVLFPRHKVIGLPARALITGGGAFHCITQQEPG
ncbi:MAG TPA: agmatine deiminase family protein [Caulobacteraceae bacterium]|jgi:agmatine deiminase|nr:agmatine deiminase family protein [Caulobacteraceae bacterium]